jgi:AcrR family transcriptional regulator
MAEKKTVDRKALIVDAAQKSFAMFGYKATTMELVARLAGVGKGTIYTFFATKEELFSEIISRLRSEMRAVVVSRIEENRSFFDNLTDVMYGILQFRETHELVVKLIQEEREVGTTAVTEGLGVLEDAVIGFIERQIRTAQQKGELRDVNPSITAFMMMRVYLALAAEWSRRHAPLSKDEVAEQLTGLFQYGICAKG